MKHFDTLQSKDFQALFLKHFIFDGGKFINNDEESKESFYHYEDDNASLCHDQVIAEAYAFFECDQGIYLSFEDLVIYCNSESDLIPIGDNLLSFTEALAEDDNILDVCEVVAYEKFKRAIQKYGPFEQGASDKRVSEFIARLP